MSQSAAPLRVEVPSSSTKPSPNTASACPPSPVYPPEHPYRTLVLCFDGTGDQFDSDNSNIVELFTLLKRDDPTKQMVYYQSGIGTYTIPQIATPLKSSIAKLLDEGFANYLDAHIMGGYAFLMQNYKAGDRICIFGFSRGAYTARCLAGMIHKVGLLPIGNEEQVPFAYKMYTRANKVGWKQSNAFRKAFSIDVDIEFVGVWDSVSSVGIIPRRLPFTTSNTIINTFRHAISLDERRANFQPNLWNRPTSAEMDLSDADRRFAHLKPDLKHEAAKGSEDAHFDQERELSALEKAYSKDRATPTDIDEVWFAGCHCDVGGGSVVDGTKPCLARIPLRWMIRECFRTKCGVMFSGDALRSLGLDPDAVMAGAPRPPALNCSSLIIRPDGSPVSQSHTSNVSATEPPVSLIGGPFETEEEQEQLDALAPKYDRLCLAWGWWLLEIMPIKHRHQRRDDSWSERYGWNLGRGRKIPMQDTNGVRVHRSVKSRMDASFADGSKYTPKADMNLRYVTWVD